MTRPPCFNRAPYTDPLAGWHYVGDRVEGVVGRAWETRQRPILRYRWPWFENRCAAWDGTGITGPAATDTRYPLAMGWNCDGCRWLPDHVARELDHADTLDALDMREAADRLRRGKAGVIAIDLQHPDAYANAKASIESLPA